MLGSKSRQRRGGILVGAVTLVAVLSLVSLSALAFRPTSTSSSARAPKPRLTPPGEIATVIRLAGVDPEALAAAGVSGLGCDGVFDAGNIYCLQADRLDQIRLASRALNLAKDRVVHPPVGSPPPNEPTVAQAEGILNDLKNGAFAFVTADLTQGQKDRLTAIRTAKHWGLPAPYLTVERSAEQWMTLRGALSNKRFCDGRGISPSAAVTQTISTADADPTVSQAKQDLANNLGAVRDSWSGHEHPAPGP